MSPTAEIPTYYEQWGPVARRMRKAGHFCRFMFKTLFRMRPRVLVEINWRLGDEIMASPVYEEMTKLPHSPRIDVLCNYPELLEGNPFVDSVNPRKPRPDIYYLLRGAPRDEQRSSYYARRMRFPKLGRPRLYYSDWKSDLVDVVPASGGPIVAIAPGASWRTKRWPEGRWHELFSALEGQDFRVVVLGNEHESLGIGTDFCGRTSVREAAALLHGADVLVCNDSGLMHLALAAGTPVVAMFGPTDPAILVQDDPAFHSITNGRECRGCWNTSQAMQEPGVCPLGIDSCMETISVDEVLGKIELALGKTG